MKPRPMGHGMSLKRHTEHTEATAALVHNGGWLRFDCSRLAEERGTCYVALGRPDLAETALTAARQTGSGVISRELRGLQPHLAPLLAHEQVRQLNADITALAGRPTITG